MFESISALPNGSLAAVSCISATECAAVGTTEGESEPMAAHWNGSEWTKLTSPSSPGASKALYRGVSCASGDTCTAVGQTEGSDGLNRSISAGFGEPRATTEEATAMTGTAATLHATIDPDGWETTYQFEYGTTKAYGTKVPLLGAPLVSDTSVEAVTAAIAGLASGTKYHYRIVASSLAETVSGKDKTLKTP